MLNVISLILWPLLYFYTVDYDFIMDNKMVSIGFFTTIICILRNTFTLKNDNTNDNHNYHSLFVQKGFQLIMTLLCLMIFLYYGTLPKEVNRIIYKFLLYSIVCSTISIIPSFLTYGLNDKEKKYNDSISHQISHTSLCFGIGYVMTSVVYILMNMQ